MKLSVVVVNWNGREHLEACLEALGRQTHRELEIIVVDNGSTDDSAAMVRDSFRDVALVAAGENLGFSEGCNRGIERSTAEWVCMLNNDTVAEEDWAAALAHAAAAADADVGMLQSRLLFMARETINSTGIELQRDGGGCDRGEGEPFDARPAPDEIFCPTAGAAAYRRSMLDAVRLADGYFDRHHFLYFEDMDLGWRARLAGWSALYVPDSVVRHRYHASSDRHDRAWLTRLVAVNRVRMLLKNASWPFILRSCPKTLSELGRLAWRGGLPAMKVYGGAIAVSLAARAEVGRLLLRDRRAVERSWER